MRKLIIFFTLLLMIMIWGCEGPPTVSDLKLNNDSSLYAGEGEVCYSPYVEVGCKEGLECRLVTSNPQIIKVCYPPDKELEEDLVYRQLYENDTNYKQSEILSKTPKNLTEEEK